MSETPHLDELGCPIDLNEINESLWNDKCDYINIEQCSNLNPNNYNLNIIQLNIRSQLAHQTELKDLLQQLYNKNSTIDIIPLSETFLTKKTEKLVNILGYQLLSNSHMGHKGRGVCFLLKDGIWAKWRKDLETFTEKEIETLYIEINSKCSKKIVLGSLY